MVKKIKKIMEANQLQAKDLQPQLRIGNYLYDREDNLCKVTQLGEGTIYAPAIDKATTKLPNKPIPLSEDVLLRLGFDREREDDKYGRVWINKGFGKFIIRRVNFNKPMLEPIDYGFTLEYSDEKDWVGIVRKVQFVHQLQNLYHSLTGEELTFKK